MTARARADRGGPPAPGEPNPAATSPWTPNWEPGQGHRLLPYARTDRALRAAAELIRKVHPAAAGFAPALTSYRFDPRPPQPGEVVSHCDLGPWNTVYRDGTPVGFIDWDGAGPVDPLADLAAAAWTFVPLAPPEQLAEAGFDPLPGLPARLRTFVDAYGRTDRKAILPELQACTAGEAEWLEWLQSIAGDLSHASNDRDDSLDYLILLMDLLTADLDNLGCSWIRQPSTAPASRPV